YSPGDIIFAKLKGFPWWPGRIENEKDLPEHIMKIRRKQAKSTTYTIFFFGSNDYQFFNPKDIRPFEPNTVKKDLEAQKYKTRDLQEAISQAIAATKKTSVDVKEGKAKKGKQKKVEETKIEKVNQQKKEDKASIEKGKETNDKSKPKRKENMAKSTPTITGRPKRTRRRADSEAPQDANDKKRRVIEEFKKTKDFLRVYQLRHRLQKYVYNRKPGDIPESEYGAISSLVKDIENEKNMTIDLLKYTKIGKVIKLTSAYDYGENDKFDIAGRCNQIIENWKHLVFEYQRDPEPL
ncbi:hypothetical protein BDF20DRAFT_808901, partial [Mycotypha africana]|uniref:uncharacterized protein n=1 Tax=Mycotypha africana TaxID=64632 RepID=UPI0023017735